MAERRMFAKSVISSARFLRMPSTSRLLYYDLGMSADDDGVVEAFTVMRTTGATEDDLRVLVSKGFVVVLNEDLVTYITDWTRNNLIKKDRYNPSIYASLLVQLPAGSAGVPCGFQVGSNTEPEVRLGKDSIGKVSLGKESVKADKPPAPAPAAKPKRKSYGQFGWVKLSDEEYSRLLNDLGESEVKRCIRYVDESAQTTGNKNKWRDWNLVIRKCSRDGWGLSNTTAPMKNGGKGFQTSNPFLEMLQEVQG